MNEHQAFMSVRAKFPMAVPVVQSWGNVRCLQNNMEVAVMKMNSDQTWSVTFSDGKNQESSVAPVPTTPAATSHVSLEPGVAVVNLDQGKPAPAAKPAEAETRPQPQKPI